MLSPISLSSRRLLAGAALILATACATDPTGPSQPRAGAASPLLQLDACTDVDLNENTLAGAGWTKAWGDDFNTLASWNIWTGGAWNDELQYYQAGNLSISNGILSIAARRQAKFFGATNPYDATLKEFEFTSGRIESKDHFSASTTIPKVRFAARLKLAAGDGMWPAFWSYGDPWPTQGEIDILEARGNVPNQYQTAYYYGKRSGVNLVRASATVITTTSSLMDCWHVYEVIWTKDALVFLLDGKEVDRKTSRYVPSLFGKKQRITLNLAVGGVFFPGILPSSVQPGIMQADWVKVFTLP
jgi:beta-glucanase (GH16 family)